VKFTLLSISSVALGLTLWSITADLHAAGLCPVETVERICAPANEAESFVVLDCDLDFHRQDCESLGMPNVLTKKLIFLGSTATGVTVDLAGAHLDGGKGQFNHQRGDMIEVRSREVNQGKWEVPSDIEIRNVSITGSIRLYGLGRNGEADAVREASRKSNGQTLIRDAAPKKIMLDSLTIEGTGRNPVYFGPGVMMSSLLNSTVKGYSTRVGVYLDAETAHNRLTGNTFSVKTNDGSWLGFYDRGWPQIALDGSSFNDISNNTFDRLNQGGVFLYRNCGEGGTVRYASPSYNRITNNRFLYQRLKLSDPAIFIGSRNYGRFENWWPGSHCNDDARFSSNGSAQSNGDFAQYNIVKNNLFDVSDLGRQTVESKKVTIKQLIRIGDPQRDHSNELDGNMIDR